MRVLIVSPVAPLDLSQIGGTRTYTLGLLKVLHSQNVDVWLAGLKGADHAGTGIHWLLRDNALTGHR